MKAVLSSLPARIILGIVMPLALLAGIHSRAQAAKDPIGCGAVVVADYTLQGDIGPCPGDGLTVVSNGITVNLNGYKIYASRRQNVGIRVDNVSNVVVKGGAVDGFDAGVLLIGGWNNRVTHIVARNNRIGIHVTNAPSGAHVVEKSTAVANRLFGILASDLSHLSIAKNSVLNNLGYGVVLDGEASYGSIANNEIRQNSAGGIELREGTEWFSYANLIPPLLEITAPGRVSFSEGVDFHVGGNFPAALDLTARVVPVGIVFGPGANALDNPIAADTSASGCTLAEYAAAGLRAGDIALVQRGMCLLARKVELALESGAAAVIIFNEGQSPGRTSHDFGYVSGLSGLAVPAPVVFASYRAGFEIHGLARLGDVFMRIKAHNSLSVISQDGFAHHNLITKNTADKASDDNSFCADLTNVWLKNTFGAWNRPCVAGDLSGDSGSGGLGSRARLY
jgi:hypothetical protein